MRLVSAGGASLMDLSPSLAAGTGRSIHGLRLRAPFDVLTRTWLKIAAGLSIGVVYGLKVRTGPSAIFFWAQDVPVLVVCIAVTACLGFARFTLPPRLAAAPAALWPWLLALACLAVGVCGAPLIFGGYTLAQDEFLANFDARIFASGRLFAPVPAAWRADVGALQPIYMLPLPSSLWASGYLPVNAALRALAMRAGMEAFVNPALGAFSIVAVWAVGRRLWPLQPWIAVIAAAFAGTSAQLIVTSMTAYAMPAHLAFNLAWLWLFLKGGRLGHAGAILVGFLASGLHQLFFHPLFVAPFVLQLWLDRRWRLAGLYTGAYGLIGLFWLAWWPVTMHLAGVAAASHAAPALGGWWLSRIEGALGGIRIDNFGVMGEALIRFVSWQNPLAAPLFVAGAMAALRLGGTLRALVLGVILTLAAMLLLPGPTQGWGYRYLHGLIGSVALVAAAAWAALAARLAPAERRVATGALALACAISLAALTPIRAWQAWSYVRPYAAADRAIRSSGADVVVIDHLSRSFFDLGTLNRNGPFGANAPKVLALAAMDDDALRRICAGRRVVVFDGATASRFGIDLAPMAPPAVILRRRALMTQLGCDRPFPA